MGFVKRSTRDAEVKMREANILCWIETQRKMKWRLTTRIASHPETRWTNKAATWNPGLSIGANANRAEGRPRKRWEDNINQFLKSEETEATKSKDFKNNDTWIWQRKTKMERNGKRLCQETENTTDHDDGEQQPTAPTLQMSAIETTAILMKWNTTPAQWKSQRWKDKASRHEDLKPWMQRASHDIPSESDDSRVRSQRRQILCLTSGSSS